MGYELALPGSVFSLSDLDQFFFLSFFFLQTLCLTVGYYVFVRMFERLPRNSSDLPVVLHLIKV